ncbi:MAG: hypothetical protein HQL49_01360 [Gammaproteobacteria bacterium]|nr:hypothetical protein [Gammaproteobacteria bacterium]
MSPVSTYYAVITHAGKNRSLLVGQLQVDFGLSREVLEVSLDNLPYELPEAFFSVKDARTFTREYSELGCQMVIQRRSEGDDEPRPVRVPPDIEEQEPLPSTDWWQRLWGWPLIIAGLLIFTVLFYLLPDHAFETLFAKSKPPPVVVSSQMSRTIATELQALASASTLSAELLAEATGNSEQSALELLLQQISVDLNPADSLPQLFRKIEAHRLDPLLRQQLSAHYEQQAHEGIDESIGMLRVAIAFNPENRQAWLLLYKTHQNMKNDAETKAIAAEIMRRFPDTEPLELDVTE